MYNKQMMDYAVRVKGSVAFSAALLLFLSVYYEFSFYKFHKNADDIYHFYFKIQDPNQTSTTFTMPVTVLKEFKDGINNSL